MCSEKVPLSFRYLSFLSFVVLAGHDQNSADAVIQGYSMCPEQCLGANLSNAP